MAAPAASGSTSGASASQQPSWPLVAALGVGVGVGWLLRAWALPRVGVLLRRRRAVRAQGDASAWLGESLKILFVVRSDLGMSRGKIASQVAHATAGALLREVDDGHDALLREYTAQGQPKVVTKVTGEAALEAVEARCHELGLPTFTVADAGRTQVESGAMTCLSVGPAPRGLIDEACSHLKLL